MSELLDMKTSAFVRYFQKMANIGTASVNSQEMVAVGI